MNNENETLIHGPMGLAKKLIFKLLSKIRYGKIIIRDKDAYSVFSGREANLTQSVTININNSRVYKTILFQGSIGAAKSYIEGDWETDDLTKLIEIIIKNKRIFNQIESPIAKSINFLLRLIDKLRPNNITQAKNNIFKHYDLGNDFFKLFLDPTMMYSCALYEPEHISQEQASKNKLMTICKYLQLKPSDHILEIGTGWGGFAFFAAREYGCKITTTTISDKQFHYVKNEIKRLGLQNQIELLNVDYRKLTGHYEKLVSIEMIEAVGHQYFDNFFHQCNSRLKAGGLFFLQAIVINDQAYETAKNEIDFIKKYIFPGGCLASIHSITQSVANKTHLQLLLLRDIGAHYVNTLNDWHQKLLLNKDTLIKQGFNNEFFRMWEFYFCYCAAGFKTNYISDIHVLWRKKL